MSSYRLWLPIVILIVGWAAGTSAQGIERDEKGRVDGVLYLIVYGGVGQMTGDVNRITEVDIPTTSAADIYEVSPQWGVVVGGHGDRLLLEVGIEGGLLSLADRGKDLIQSVLDEEASYGSNYISFEQTVGVAHPLSRNLVAYGAAAWSALGQVLDREPHNTMDDWGFGTALKAGFNWYIFDSYLLRFGARYQAWKLGVEVPHVLTYTVGIGGCATDH